MVFMPRIVILSHSHTSTTIYAQSELLSVIFSGLACLSLTFSTEKIHALDSLHMDLNPMSVFYQLCALVGSYLMSLGFSFLASNMKLRSPTSQSCG